MKNGKKNIVLAKGGKPRFRLQVNPPQDAEAMLPALSEMVMHLERCLAQPVQWFDRWSGDSALPLLTLEFSPESALDREEFEIAADAGAVCLRGATPAALTHAVHYFLEQAFGVRWLWPGKDGTVAPRARRVVWPLGTVRPRPDWRWRRLWVGGAFWKEDDAALAELKAAKVSPGTLDELSEWRERNRLGGLMIADGHRWAQICSPRVYGKTHPEYFALVNGRRDVEYKDGKHGNQPCTSNPEVVALTARHIIAQFRARPELDGFSMAVNDGMGFCECDACRAIDRWAGAKGRSRSEFDRLTDEVPGIDPGNRAQPAMTDRMLRFANQVAERVAAVYPEKLLLVLIYSVYREPPLRTRLHPNAIAQFCTMTHAHVNKALFRQEIDVLRKVRRFTKKTGIYDYFVNGANGTLPRGFYSVFARSLRAYYDCGCRYFATQAGLDFALNGFVYYLAARLLWDSSLDAERELEDYCRAGFGKGWRQIQRYIKSFAGRWENAGRSACRVEELAGRLYPRAWRKARREDLRQATRLCRGDRESAARVAFLGRGLDFLDLFCEASAAALDLIAAGAPPESPFDEQGLRQWARAASPGKMRRAVRCRRRLLEWVESHADGFLVSAMWFHYQRLCRNGLLGRWMDVVETPRTR